MDESVFTLYDRVALARTGNLVTGRSDAAIIRMFNDLLASDERMGKHADDYEIRCIGAVDEEGNLVAINPRTVATGSQWRASQVPALVKDAANA